MLRGRTVTLAAALAAGVAAYAVPQPAALPLHAAPRSADLAAVAIPVPLPPPPEAEEHAADAALPPMPGEPDPASSAGDSTPDDDALPIQLAAAPARPAADPEWRVEVNISEAGRCEATAGSDCALLAIRFRVWDFAVELGDDDDAPLIEAATPIEADGAPAVAADAAAAPAPAAPRVIAPPPAVGRIAALQAPAESAAPRFTVAPPPPAQEPRRNSWWRNARNAVQVAPNAYLDVANIVGSADPPRQERGSDGAVTRFEGGAQEGASTRLRFGLSIPLETLSRSREHRAAPLPPPSFANGPAQ